MRKKYLFLFCASVLLAPAINSQTCTTPTISGTTVCAGNTYTIANPGPGNLAFYSTSMSFLAQANSYTTAPATTTAYNYVAVENVGAPDNSIGSGGYYTTTGKAITFNVTTAVLINTIDVYPQNGGSITIAVKNAANTVVAQTTVTIPAGGLQTIPLGFNIPAGTGYKMELISETCGGLYRNGSGNAFPYNSPSGIVSLTTTDYAILGYYYYFYNWSVSSVACVNTLTLTVSSPTAAISASGNSLSTGSFTSYQWFLNDNPISGATSQNYSATQNGVYTVSVTNAFGCSATSTAYTVSVATGISDKSISAGYSVYPNPLTSDVLTVESAVQQSNGLLSLSIYSTSGQLIKRFSSGDIISGDGKYSVHLDGIPDGIYLLHFESNNLSGYQKLIVNR